MALFLNPEKLIQINPDTFPNLEKKLFHIAIQVISSVDLLFKCVLKETLTIKIAVSIPKQQNASSAR